MIKLFYEMYPDSDPKYWSNFKFVKHTRSGKLDSIDVYCRSDRCTGCIIKGKNDEDARWRQFLHSSPLATAARDRSSLRARETSH